ncbi:MAG: tetratricopeptide repeat protein, partial [Bacteroidota bacterium]
DNADYIIWYGRRTAYLGHYEEAITIYSDGIEKHPDDPRFYRHRGHRYISLRKFDKAIADLERATQLIEGKEDKTEPDGMPNALNIPVSTLHSNIWYHLGLAYYLKNDMEKSHQAYLRCRNLKSNDDNLVSSTHWLYMIQRRMGNDTLATKLLEPVHDTMTIIENFSYYKLCKFYKGMIPVDSLRTADSSPADDAVRYGLANWYFYNGNVEKSRMLMAEILEGTSWNSFGYIAAERDYLNAFNK